MGGWASLHVSGRLVVDGKEFECVMANISYQLNTIPQAQFMVAVGRGHSALKPAQIHRSKFTIQVPLQYYATIKPLAGDVDPDIPGEEFLLFDGYLTGLSWDKSLQHDRAVLHAKHWLLDMDYSSALSDSSHPLNPSQFSYRPVHDIPGAGGISFFPQTQQGFITPSVLQEDFWGKGLYPWLYALTEEDMINTVELAHLGQPGKNDTAQKALKRFTLTEGNYAPLSLDMAGADALAISDAIWNDVQMESYETFAVEGTTLWNKLVGAFGTRYLFAVVPRVEDALVIPYIPGLRKTWEKDIKASEYALTGASSQLIRLLRGMGIFAGLNSRTGADGHEPGKDPMRLGIGGWFGPEDLEQGMVMLKQGPRWLSNLGAADRYSLWSAGAGANIIGTAMHPGVGEDGGPTKPKDLKIGAKNILDHFAEALYVYEQLKLRQFSLSGKFRVDIAPGSTIKVEVAGDRFIEANTLAKNLVGDVVRVTYTIDSETPRISTDFHLAHVRTEDENSQEGFSIDRHPLWTEPWPGAQLLPEGPADALKPANG